MPTQRYYTATWANPDGTFTGVLLDIFDTAGDWPTAVAQSQRAANEQLRDLLRWQARRDHWLPESEITVSETLTIRVDVRPQHRLQDRTITFPDTVPIPVVCVCATRGDDLKTCIIPALELSFDYAPSDELKPLVQQYVQQHVKGFDTRRIGRLLRPGEVQIDTMNVSVKFARHVDSPELKLPALSVAAEPVLGRHGGSATAWGRDGDIEDLTNRLETERVSVLVMGPPGIGKSTVINAAAANARRQRKLNRTDPAGPPRYRRTSASRLIAGMKYLGQWEQRCEQIIDELSLAEGVLCIDNLLELLRVGSSPSQSLAAFFAPYIEHGDLRLVAEATEEELDACRRLLPSLVNQLQVLRLDPWPRATAIQVLTRQAERFAERYNVTFEPTAPELIYRLVRRFLPHQAFPGHAIALMQDAFSFAHSLEQCLDNDITIDRFAEATGLPDIILRDELPLPRDQVLDYLTGRVVGQPEPCELLADLVVTFKSAMNDTGRPIGVALLCGPTGVGKTETAKALADFLFPHLDLEKRLVRLDMSEFSGPGAAERFTSQPSGEPSAFIHQVRSQPFSVLLLDEIEKAEPEVFDLLLGVLDEGRLVDTYGRMTDFRCCFLLMTSNIAGDISQPFGFSREVKVDEQSEVLSVFRPEFFNRLDAVVRYRPLIAESMQGIARLHLDLVAKRQGLSLRNLQIEFTDRLVTHIARVGLDPMYGARPLQRVIEEFVITPLAQRLVTDPGLRDAKIEFDMVDQAPRLKIVKT